jgi:hypothetical protein
MFKVVKKLVNIQRIYVNIKILKIINYKNLNFLNPYNSLKPKIWSIAIWSACAKENLKNQFFLLAKLTTYFTSFPGSPSMSNSDSV